MQDVPNAFTRWLQDQLDERDWSQSELARQAGVSSAMISDVLSGNANPGWGFCKKVASALDLPPENVLRLAQHLDPEPEYTATRREADHVFSQLSDEDQGRALAMMRSLLQLLRDRAGPEPEMT